MALLFPAPALLSFTLVAALASLVLLSPRLALGGETSRGPASPLRTTVEAFDSRAWTPLYPRGYDLDGRTGSVYAPYDRNQVLRIFAGSETAPSIITSDFGYNVPSSIGPVGTLFYYNGESAMLGGPFCGYGAIGQYIPLYGGGGSPLYPTFPVHGAALGYPLVQLEDFTGNPGRFMGIQVTPYLVESRESPGVGVVSWAIPDIDLRAAHFAVENLDDTSLPSEWHWTFPSAWTGHTDPPYLLIWGDNATPPSRWPYVVVFGNGVPEGELRVSFSLDGFTTDTVTLRSHNQFEYFWYPAIAPLAGHEDLLPSRIGFMNRPEPTNQYLLRAAVDSMLGFRPVAGTFGTLDASQDGVVDSGDVRLLQERGM